MVLNILFICLTLEFLFALFVFKTDVLAPAVIFSGVFVLASLDLMLMVSYWEVSLEPITAAIIILGVFVYILVAYLTSRTKQKRIVIKKYNRVHRGQSYHISKRVLTSIIVLYFGVIFLVIYTVVRNYSLRVSIFNYINILGKEELVELPAVVKIIYDLFLRFGYVCSYLFAYQLSINKKPNIRLLIIILETAVLSLSNGKRGELLTLASMTIVMVVLFLRKSSDKRMSKKVYGLIFLGLIIMAFSFQNLGFLLQRRDTGLFSPFEYFSIYLGAPIMNLDTSIAMGNFTHPVPLSETFRTLYNSIGKNLGIESLVYKTDRIFLASKNGLRAGNVDTVFYDYFHDAGFIGIILLTAIMAWIVQSLYNRIKKGDEKNPMMTILIYANMYWLTARSFFANSLLDWFTLSTLELLLVWYVSSLLLRKNVYFVGRRNHKSVNTIENIQKDYRGYAK